MTLFPYGSALPWGQTVLSVHPGQERYGRGDGSFPAFEASDHVAQGVAPVSRSMALEPAEKLAAKEYLAPNCVPKDTVPFEVPHCLRRR